MRKFPVLIISVCLILCIAGCTSPNEKGKIVTEGEATTSFVEAVKPYNSTINNGNNLAEKSTLSTETTSPDASKNVAEKVSKESVIFATTAKKPRAKEIINLKTNLLQTEFQPL